MSEEVKTGNAILYEIIDKGTGLVEPVNRLGGDDVDHDEDMDLVVHKEDGTQVVFAREGSTEAGGAIFVNSGYVIRDRDTKLAPNGLDLVEDIVVGGENEVVAEGEATTLTAQENAEGGVVTE